MLQLGHWLLHILELTGSFLLQINIQFFLFTSSIDISARQQDYHIITIHMVRILYHVMFLCYGNICCSVSGSIYCLASSRDKVLNQAINRANLNNVNDVTFLGNETSSYNSITQLVSCY